MPSDRPGSAFDDRVRGLGPVPRSQARRARHASSRTLLYGPRLRGIRDVFPQVAVTRLHRHGALLVRPADPRRLFAVAGDDPDTLVELGDDVFGGASLEK